jgi:hypothetical protein
MELRSRISYRPTRVLGAALEYLYQDIAGLSGASYLYDLDWLPLPGGALQLQASFRRDQSNITSSMREERRVGARWNLNPNTIARRRLVGDPHGHGHRLDAPEGPGHLPGVQAVRRWPEADGGHSGPRALARVAALLLLAAAGPAAAGKVQPVAEPIVEGLRVAVLPFTSRGAGAAGWSAVRGPLTAQLQLRGVDLVDADAVEAAVRQRRLRDVSILTTAELRELASALGADRLVLGSLYRFDQGAAPAVSLSARVVAPGDSTIRATAAVALDWSDLVNMLDRGGRPTLDATLHAACARLADRIGLSGQGPLHRERARLLKESTLAPDPIIYMSPQLGPGSLKRVAVLPFRNPAGRPGAGQAAAELSAWSLHASGAVQVVEPGDVTRRLLARGWRIGATLPAEPLRDLGLETGVDGLLIGSVDRWKDGSPSGVESPEIAISMRLLEAATGRILWSAVHERRGDQTRVVFELGAERLAEALLARSAHEVLAPLCARLGPLESVSAPESRR